MTTSKVTYSLLHHEEGGDEPSGAIVRDKYDNDAEYTSAVVATEANRATRFSSYINLTNTIVGSGMLGLPYAFAKTGWILGSFLLVFSAIVSIFSLHILSICAQKTSIPSSFYSVTEATIPRFTFLIDLAVTVQCFGVGISYLIVIGGLMPAVMQQFDAPDFWQQRLTWVVIGFSIVAPLSCLPNLDALKFTSFFAIVFVFFLTGLVIAYAAPNDLNACLDFDPDEGGSCVGPKSNAIVSLDTFRVFSIFIFAFSCQQNIFPVVNEMKSPSTYRINTVILAAIGTASVIYACVALAGYSTYGANVSSNILTNYPRTPLTSATRIFVSLLVAFSYPLQIHPSRSSAMALWKAAVDKKDGEPLTPLALRFRFIVTTICYLLGSFGIAMVLDDLGVILALVGATGATIVAFILPGVSYYVLHKDEGPSLMTYAALALCVAGLIIMPVCVAFIFI